MTLSSRAGAVIAASSIATAGVVGGVVVHAQGGSAPPVVPISVDTGKAPVVGAQNIAAGPTTFDYTSSSAAKGGDDTPDGTVVYVPAGSDANALQQTILSKITGKSDPTIPVEKALKAAKAGVVMDGAASKGHPASKTITLQPGTYLAFNTTSDKKWYASQFTVGAQPNGATAPAPAVTVTMTDYKYSVSGPLKRGQIVRFQNKGSALHMAIPFKVANKAAAAAAVKALKKAKNPDTVLKKYVRGEGKTQLGVLSPGGAQDFAIEDKPGTYLWVCFFTTSNSRGKAHFNLGMEKTFTVK